MRYATAAIDFALISDVMMDLEGSVRPAIFLADALVKQGYKVSMISPIMSSNVERRLSESGITPVNFKARLISKSLGLSTLWFELWAREAFLGLNSRQTLDKGSVRINFSQVVSVPSSIWYLQGPPSTALKDMEEEFSTGFRIAYNVLKPFIERSDGGLVSRAGISSSFAIANSRFCASMYSKFAVKIHDVIYPPIDCQTFCPSAANPFSNYVLTYFGKETKFSIIKKIADAGVKIKAFGSKTPFISEKLRKNPNIEFLGKVSTSELVDLYSNALFTLFAFTHEPFGYVPLESMACGTPVVTYAMQGPSEYVAAEHTGWLAQTDGELAQKSVGLWKEGYNSSVRMNCVREALRFDKQFYAKKWLETLSCLEDRLINSYGLLKVGLS